jgi:hypothetical protein
VKELFQREMKQYDTDGEKKEKIIAEYKKVSQANFNVLKRFLILFYLHK